MRPEALRAGEVDEGKYTYLSGFGPPAIASLSEVSPEFVPADDVATPTSGKFWRKLAINSSPGF